MKIIFMGTPEFAVPSLEAIVNAGHEVAAVVTNKDEPQGRGLKVAPPAVKIAADGLKLPVIQVSSLKDSVVVERLSAICPDVMVVVAFRILPREVYSIPKRGTFNLHGSLLPKYRGAAPINWAIINGESETGVTTFFLDDKVDTGKIILQRRIQIGENETAGELSYRLSVLGADAVAETLVRIENGRVDVMEQDSSLSTKAPKITKEDCLIDWSNPASYVHNFVRGFSPEPCAYTFLGSKMVKIFRTRLTREAGSHQLGGVRVVAGKFLVSCEDEFLEILELQLEGKKRLTSADFLRGARIELDARFSQERK